MRDDVVMKLDLDLVRAAVLDRALEDDPVPLDFQAAEFGLEPFAISLAVMEPKALPVSPVSRSG